MNNCNGAKVAVRHPKTGTSYTLDIRAYNDGVALPPPRAGRRLPHARRSHRIPRSGGSTIAPQKLRVRLRGTLPVADHDEYDRGHDGR